MAMTPAERQRAYKQRMRDGVVLPRHTLQERFSSKVRPEPNGCWRWTASFLTTGYGQLNINGRPVAAHRVSYILCNGPIPKGMDVCHRCDNRWCVNPSHLWLGTRKENLQDMWAKGRGNTPGLQGEKHHQAKLTEEIVHEIRCSPLKGVELAAKYGVTKTTISDIRNRRSWTHI